MTSRPKLNTEEAAAFLGVKRNTLEVWRCKRRGPKYSKMGRRVLYSLEDLEDFFTSRLVHTCESPSKCKRGR